MEMDFNSSPSDNSKERYEREDILKNNHYSNKPFKYETQKKEKKEYLEKNELINKLIEYNTSDKTENKNSGQEKNDEDESDSIIDDNKINFYDVQKNNIINYMTPIKVNNINNSKRKKKTKTENISNEKENNDEDNNDLSDLFSNSSTDNKKVMVSELDIELSNSQSNYHLNTDTKWNNINMVKRREIDFKKEIEQNLKKFLKKNQEMMNTNNTNKNKNKSDNIIEAKNHNNNINVNSSMNNNVIKKEIKMKLKDKIKLKMKRFKKQSNKINYCLTDINKKIYKKNNNLNHNTCLQNNNNKISSFNNHINSNFNTSFKKQQNEQNNNNNKNNIQKKLNEIIKINIPQKKSNTNVNNKIIVTTNKKTNINLNKKQKTMNLPNIYEIKSKIFYLQNKNKKKAKEKISKKNDLSEYIISNRNNEKIRTVCINNLNNINDAQDLNEEGYYNNSEKKYVTEKLNTKSGMNTIINSNYGNLYKKNDSMNNMNGINNKNIIIQNFNCIDYNNINININNNINNIIKPFKYQKKRNNSNKNKNISIKKINNSLNPLINYSNFKKSKNNYNNTITKKEKLHHIKYLCDSYIKNTKKNNISFNNSKFYLENKNNFFKRLHNEKKLTYKENSDIKNKILNYYLNKKEGIKTFHKKKAKYIKVNENMNDNTNDNMNNNVINEESSSCKKRDIKNKITKQKTYKQIENPSFSNNAFNGKKKFIRSRKEKRKTEVCSNNIKKNLCEFKFIHIK